MEEDMEMEEVFVVHEVDIDYEYDAPRFFNFTREETQDEAHVLERWFESAKSYPPSRSRFLNHISSDELKLKVGKDKPRSSTLMKPTASILAKQFQPSQVISSRLQTLPCQFNQRILVTLGSEGQASKRQKLEEGHMCKPVEVNQTTNLVHKVPKKDGIEKISTAKLRLTIPREPDLETAQRATRMRLQNNNQMEDLTVSVRRFKARPLNRKILEAPQLPLPQKSTPKLPEFKLFHLKTLERAAHSSSSAASPQSSWTQCDDSKKELCEVNKASSVAESRNNGVGRTSTSNFQIHGSQFLFKAHSLNRKALSSKLRNDKHGTTVPIEFTFQSDKSSQQIPPTELFSKLSLSSVKEEPHKLPCSQLLSFQHPCTQSKGSKENRYSSSQKQTWMMEEKRCAYYGHGGRHPPKLLQIPRGHGGRPPSKLLQIP